MEYEMMKLKYRNLIKNQDSVVILIIVNKVLTDLQYLLVKNNYKNEQELLDKIHILNGIDTNLYKRLYEDIKNKTLLESDILKWKKN